MIKYVACFVFGALLIPSSTFADTRYKQLSIEWSLMVGKSAPDSEAAYSALPKGDYAFQDGNFSCKINAAQAFDGPGGYSEARAITCKSSNGSTISTATYCSRHKNANTSDAQVNGKWFAIGCVADFGKSR